MKYFYSIIISFMLFMHALQAANNLLPELGEGIKQKNKWEKARNEAARAVFTKDKLVIPEKCKSSLKIEMKSPQGYGEWRVENLRGIKAGLYTFRVLVKNNTEKAPYFMIYSFDQKNSPRLIAGEHGRAGSNDWYYLCGKVNVPADSCRIRIGIGLSDNRGVAWFAAPELIKGDLTKMKLAKLRNSAQDSWGAEWLWVEDPGSKIPNVIFQKDIVLEDQAVSGNLQITADNLYELELNGKPVGNDSDWKTVDNYDVSRLLKKGKNTIKISVMNFGGPGGAILQGKIWLKNGKSLKVKTDKSWKYTVPGMKKLPALVSLGVPPARPWGKIPLKNLARPESVNLTVSKYSASLKAGDVFRVVFDLPFAIPEEEIANLKLEFYRNNKRAVISAYKAIITKYWDKKHLAVELPISKYACPGKYSWRLRGINLLIKSASGKQIVKIKAAELKDFTPARYPAKAANKMKYGKHSLQAPFVYCTMTPSVKSFINWQITNGHIYECVVTSGYWMGAEKWNFEKVERDFMKILEADQQASIFVRLRIDTPSWWIRKYPDECFLSQKGRRGPQSFTSEVWRQSASKAIKAFVDQLEKKPIGRHLAGIVIMGFKGGEFQLWGESQGEYDCSPAAKKAFAAWQKKNSVSPEIKLPNSALEAPFPKGKKNAYIRKTFFKFVAEWHADNFIYFAEKFKKAFGNKYQFGLYFGYSMEHSGHKRMLFAGHLGIPRVLEYAQIDFISCPSSYGLRGPQRSHAFMLPAASALLHGKMVINENDIRNYKTTYAGDGSGKSLPDLATSVTSLKKLCMLSAAHGAGIRYLALLEEADFFQDSAILVNIRELNETIMGLTPAPIGQRGQIALVLNYWEYCGCLEKDYLALSRKFLSNIRDTLMRTGRSVVFITMDDWLKNSSLWKYVVFPLPGLLTSEQKKVIASRFGALPVINNSEGALLIKPKQKTTVGDLEQVRKFFATPEALKTGGKTVYYVGGNFIAKYDSNKEKLDIKYQQKR